MVGSDKHSSLLCQSVSDDEKKFCEAETCMKYIFVPMVPSLMIISPANTNLRVRRALGNRCEGSTYGGSITVPLTSCLTGLD